MKTRVIHISTGTTTTTTSILFLLLVMLTSCSAAIQPTQKTEPTQTAIPTNAEIESGAVFEIKTQTLAQCAIVTAEQALHLRAGPDETSKVIGWLKAGEIVNVDSRAGDWWKIGAGYARADYLQETECK